MKRTIFAGLIGGVVLIIWLIIVDGILGFKRDIEMKHLSDERLVYNFLNEHVTKPGRYVCNPEFLPGQDFPGDDPIFVVQYSGLGHSDAYQEMLVGIIVAFLASFLGALLLANASNRILSKFRSRLFFFSGLGTIMALFCIMTRFSIGGYPLNGALILALHDLVAWVVAGLVISWFIQPVKQEIS
ncbi:MAG: hypothetical protein ABIH76_01620 [Candidatus Bathyarchaeota archaeon]